MTRRIIEMAMLLGLASSLAFACEKPKSTSDARTDAQPVAADASTSGDTQYDTQCDCRNANPKNNKKIKQTPSQQEKDYDRQLLGIYG